LTPVKNLYRNNERNFRRGGVCGWARFFPFLTFYPFADKNSVVSSYFIVEKSVFCGAVTIDPVTVKIANWLLIRQPEQ